MRYLHSKTLLFDCAHAYSPGPITGVAYLPRHKVQLCERPAPNARTEICAAGGVGQHTRKVAPPLGGSVISRDTWLIVAIGGRIRGEGRQHDRVLGQVVSGQEVDGDSPATEQTQVQRECTCGAESAREALKW